MTQKFFTTMMLLLTITASAQLTSIGGVAQPMAGPVNPPGDLNTISFEYDTAGNQKLRKFIYLPLDAPRHAVPGPNDTASAKEYIVAEEYPEISYYPNPVKSELNLKWGNTADRYIKTFALYNLNSALLNHFPNQESQEELVIAFGHYPSGMYTLLITYNNGDQKSLKIIKE